MNHYACVSVVAIVLALIQIIYITQTPIPLVMKTQSCCRGTWLSDGRCCDDDCSNTTPPYYGKGFYAQLDVFRWCMVAWFSVLAVVPHYWLAPRQNLAHRQRPQDVPSYTYLFCCFGIIIPWFFLLIFASTLLFGGIRVDCRHPSTIPIEMIRMYLPFDFAWLVVLVAVPVTGSIVLTSRLGCNTPNNTNKNDTEKQRILPWTPPESPIG